jgi:HAD superfamily hydrolase (TIGR01509 family)
VIQAIIFDMDGLLIDSEPHWRRAHIAAVAQYGGSITEDDARAMAGGRVDEIARHWRERHNLLHVSNEQLADTIVSQAIEAFGVHGQELPGVRHVVELFAAAGIPMAVASSSAPEVIATVLDKLSLTQYMQFAHSAMHEAYGKPHPAVFLTTAKKLGVSPADCVVFEDSLNGVIAAKAAGMQCIAVPETANISKPAFQTADLVVPTLADVTLQTLEKIAV